MMVILPEEHSCMGEAFADITGVQVEMILRVRTVLQAVCSGYDLDIDRFS